MDSSLVFIYITLAPCNESFAAIGTCHMFLHRWSYFLPEDTCKLFIYNGCDGNRNNFLSEDDCEDACM